MESKLKKIGILAFVNKKAGGVLQYTQSLIDALAGDKSKKYIIFIDSFTQDINTYNLEVRKVNTSKPGLFLKLLKAIKLFLLLRTSFFENVKKSLYDDIDLFLCPRVIMYSQFFAEKPFILTIHDLQEFSYPEFFSLQEKIIRFAVTRFLSRKAEKIICESYYVKNDIKKYLKIEDSKIIVIPAPPPASFINFKTSDEKKEMVKHKYNLPDEYLFYPASFWPHKNHLKLIDAFSLIAGSRKQLYLVLSGEKQKNYSNLMTRIKEKKLQDRVLYIGYIDYGDLPYLYILSKMLVIPSLFESISIPIYEAFALKVPVCSSNVVALPEQVGDAGLLFDPKDENDIAAKINTLLSNKELQTKISSKGFDKIKEFSHVDYSKKLKELISSILSYI
jgi:glycosyltransferase involved in cell wall biosynthesis